MHLRLLKLCLGICLVVLILAVFLIWTLPVESVQTWAAAQVPNDPFARFEAIGQAEFFWVLGRYALPLLLALTIWMSVRVDRVHVGFQRFFTECRTLIFLKAANVSTADRVRGFGLFFLGLLWLGMGIYHAGAGVLERSRQWSFYRLNSGPDVLPNISDSNRDVIRYLREATAENSRILVCSDQKLFFLSYYLLPRRLFHYIHPEAEFVIPLADQARQLQAYRLSDLSAEQISHLSPDYILEYFEGAEFIDQSRIAEDPAWVHFWQARQQSSELPGYVVVLRPYSREATQ